MAKYFAYLTLKSLIVIALRRDIHLSVITS